jgi:hypothetical protein
MILVKVLVVRWGEIPIGGGNILYERLRVMLAATFPWIFS